MPSRVRVALALDLSLQLLGVGPLHVQSARRGLRAIVNFDPAAANMASCSRRNPDHVLSLLLACAGLCRWNWFEVKIQLRDLVRLGFRIRDRCLHRAIHYQCYLVNARWQTL